MKKRHTMLCFVTQPNNVVIEVDLEAKAKGEECLNQVCQQLGIVEVDYFGLQYAGSKGEQLWINMRNRISRQICGPPPYRMRLRVKFFVEPHFLLQEATRRQFFLQAWQDLCEDKLRLPADTLGVLVKLVAFTAQVEVGDYREHPSMAACYTARLPARYHDPYMYPSLSGHIAEEHAKLVGMARETAEYKMLKALSTLECYGVEYHKVKSGAGVSYHIGIGPEGIAQYDTEWKLVKSIPYATVQKAIHSGKTLSIDTIEDDGTQTTPVLQFKLVSDRAANGLYRCVTEMHSFYRCDTVRRTVASQVSRDLKGTLASLFNEHTTAGIMYEFDIQRTFIEAYDRARRILYATGSSISLPSSPTHRPQKSLNQGSNYNSTFDLCSTQECQKLKSKLDRFQDDMLCRVCMDADVDIVFCPCGHLVCCESCASRVDSCPMCRSTIKQTQHVFLPNLRLTTS